MHMTSVSIFSTKISHASPPRFYHHFTQHIHYSNLNTS